MNYPNSKKLVCVALTALLWTPTGLGCPAYLGADKVPAATGSLRRQLKLFAVEVLPSGGRRWINLPMQVDALDEKGVLKQNPIGQELKNLPIEASDRINMRREDFGFKAVASDGAPCETKKGLELQNPESVGKFAYLVQCKNDEVYAKIHPHPVSINPVLHKITAPQFEYDYQPNNQLMYKNMVAKGKHPFPPTIAVANSDVNIHLDMRKFFTMDFNNNNVESYVRNYNSGPVGMVGSIDFFLRLLFFKIDLKMATTVGFYKDSGHIPTIVDVPRDAPKMLNPGSGLMYLWTTKAASFDQSNPIKTMPFIQPAVVLSGWENHAKTGLNYCVGSECVFRLRGKVVGESFGLDINVPRDVVARGFFPAWVPNVAKFKKDMKWDDDPKEGPDVVGIYFENGGLLKGQYKLEQWLRIGPEESISTSCPRKVNIGEFISFTAKVEDGVAH
jgi:hypothetical protein